MKPEIFEKKYTLVVGLRWIVIARVGVVIGVVARVRVIIGIGIVVGV